MPKLAPGDTAPQFSLPDQDGESVSSESLKGKPAVVYFYPADDTPGCTTEACQFNDNLQQFQQAGGTYTPGHTNEVLGLPLGADGPHRSVRDSSSRSNRP